MIDSSEPNKRGSYLIHTLNSTCSMHGELKTEYYGKFVSENTEEEHGPDQCGYINKQ